MSYIVDELNCLVFTPQLYRKNCIFTIKTLDATLKPYRDTVLSDRELGHMLNTICSNIAWGFQFAHDFDIQVLHKRFTFLLLTLPPRNSFFELNTVLSLGIEHLLIENAVRFLLNAEIIVDNTSVTCNICYNDYNIYIKMVKFIGNNLTEQLEENLVKSLLRSPLDTKQLPDEIVNVLTVASYRKLIEKT